MRDSRGLLEGARWISGEPYVYGPDDAGYYDDYRNHVVFRQFELLAGEGPGGVAGELGAPVQLEIAVLGYARVLVNGVPLPNVELLGHWTNPRECVYVDRFDISGLVRPGANELRIELGNGWYNPAPLTLFGKYNLRERLAEVGTPAVAARVLCGDACVLVTDGSWSCMEGDLLFNNVYLGERCDLRGSGDEDSRADARPVTVRDLGERHFELNPAPLQKRFEAVPPQALRAQEAADNAAGSASAPVTLLDFGQMVEGILDITFTARAGQEVELRYAEELRDGEPYFASNVAGLVGLETPSGACPGGPGAPELAIQHDALICREGENRYASRFTYHSFRYVQVVGLAPADILRAEAVPVHADLPQAGTFECDNQDFMRLYDAAVRTKLNNAHDVLEDCSRERFGYGGDMVALATSNLFCFDMADMLDKTLADFRRDQTARGGLPETAPFMGIGSNGPAYGEGPLLWQLAYPHLAVMADRYCGRRDLLEREWSGIERFGRYLLSFEPEELAVHCLGDHGSIETGADFKSGTPDKDFTGWCAVLWGLACVTDAAERLGHTAEAAEFVAASEALRVQICARFEHPDGTFGNGSQTALAFAGALGLGDAEQLAAALAAKVRAAGGVLATGIFGTMLSFELLRTQGYNDVLETWLLRMDEPSLLSMLASGNGALAEQFREHLSSFDHAMFSSYVQWFYQGLGGIRVTGDAVGCDKVSIDPYFSHATDRVHCAYQTPHGTIEVAWQRTNGRVDLRICAPECINVDLSALERREGVLDARKDGDVWAFTFADAQTGHEDGGAELLS